MKTHLIHTTHGTTSKTLQSLYENGWQASKSGAVHILKDETGREVLTAFSWDSLLDKVEILMR